MSHMGTAAAPTPAELPARRIGWHWLPVGVFVLYTALNMLDRQLLAALAPTIKQEFSLNNAQYGALASVFFAVSTVASPLAGWFIDRVGLSLGASVAIVFWSLCGAATGYTQSLRGLMACRFGLAVGESGGSAAPGAILSRYMDPGEIGVGGALLGTGTSLGAIAAPLVVAAMVPSFGWRSTFVVCGLLGLLWIPIWALASKFVPPRFEVGKKARLPLSTLLRDRRLWGVTAAYALAKQTLWVTWTTVYFVDARGLTMVEANARFSWYPSVFGALGAFVVGGIAMYWVRKGRSGLEARLRTCWMLAPLLLITAAIPFIPSTTGAAIAVGLSFFASVCIWSCAHLMPLDLYGVGRAAFTYSILEASVTGMQTFMSPLVGAMVDAYGFTAVCMLMPLLPLTGLVILWACLKSPEPALIG